jgi:hypothetical protein
MLWPKRGGLLGPLLVLLLSLLLLFVQVGLYLALPAHPERGTPTGKVADGPLPDKEAGATSSLDPTVRQTGALCLGVVVLLLFWHVLDTETTSHSREFKLLRTLGYSLLDLHGIVFTEMVSLLLAAFVPALTLLHWVDMLIRAWTGLVLENSPARAGLVLVLALLLGAVATLLATRRLRRDIDPATLFG